MFKFSQLDGDFAKPSSDSKFVVLLVFDPARQIDLRHVYLMTDTEIGPLCAPTHPYLERSVCQRWEEEDLV